MVNSSIFVVRGICLKFLENKLALVKIKSHIDILQGISKLDHPRRVYKVTQEDIDYLIDPMTIHNWVGLSL